MSEESERSNLTAQAPTQPLKVVMAGLDPATQADSPDCMTFAVQTPMQRPWVAGSSPAMTHLELARVYFPPNLSSPLRSA